MRPAEICRRQTGVAEADQERELSIEHSLVGAVDIVNGEDSQVAVVTEVTQGNTGTSLKLQGIDLLLGDIEGDRHGENIAISQTAVFTDTGEESVWYGIKAGRVGRCRKRRVQSRMARMPFQSPHHDVCRDIGHTGHNRPGS